MEVKARGTYYGGYHGKLSEAKRTLENEDGSIDIPEVLKPYIR